MKRSRAEVHCQARKIPDLRFEQHSLTSFGGLVVFQQFFVTIGLLPQLRRCFRHLKGGKVFGHAKVFLQLIVHVLLGYRDLRDSTYYRNDPLVKRLLGLNELPDVSTLSRTLKDADQESVENVRLLLRERVSECLTRLHLTRITLDCDGSVQSTGRSAEGTAVGFNKKKKGARSYYPLFCTIAQTGQVYDLLHRPGNVHDSKGARQFILKCIEEIRQLAPGDQIELRMDSAFFSDEMVNALDAWNVEFTISVPFERFPRLKRMIEERKRWRRINRELFYFETDWKPEVWEQRFRFCFIRTRVKRQQKEPVQLDLFIPHEYGFDFKVIVTNKAVKARAIVAFHSGRGSQEGIFGELKSQCQMGHVPVRTLVGNQLYLLAGLLAHNLTRELQMLTTPRHRGSTAKRAALWMFEKLDSVRQEWVRRAGRLTRPHGRLTLTISATGTVMRQIVRYLASARLQPMKA
jgi:hypothetical protein